MPLTFGRLIALLGGWSVLMIAISGWVSHMIGEGLLSKWRRKEQAELESLRSVLANDRLSLESAAKSFQTGQDLNQQKRLAAVERMWAATLELRKNFSAPVFFLSILLPTEYDVAVRGGKGKGIAAAVADLTLESIGKSMESADLIEQDRPYLGETLWLQFFTYRAFLGRIAYIVVEGKRSMRFAGDWRQDSGVRQLLSYVLAEQAVSGLLTGTDSAISINRAINSLESLILKEVSLITSGRRSSFESFENARALKSSLADLNPNIAQQHFQ